VAGFHNLATAFIEFDLFQIVVIFSCNFEKQALV
jgi:hypothetical protein